MAARERQATETTKLRAQIADAQSEAAELRVMLPHLEQEADRHRNERGEELLAEIRQDVDAAAERTKAAEVALAEAKAAEAAVRGQVVSRLAGFPAHFTAARPLMAAKRTPAMAVYQAYLDLLDAIPAGIGYVPTAESHSVLELLGTLSVRHLEHIFVAREGASTLTDHRRWVASALEAAKRDAARQA